MITLSKFTCIQNLSTGYAYEEISEISPDHRFLAYTMFDKDNDCFKLSVRDLNFGSLCSKPQADRVSSIAWAKNGQALLYVVTNDKQRPFRLALLIVALIILVHYPKNKVGILNFAGSIVA